MFLPLITSFVSLLYYYFFYYLYRCRARLLERKRKTHEHAFISAAIVSQLKRAAFVVSCSRYKRANN